MDGRDGDFGPPGEVRRGEQGAIRQLFQRFPAALFRRVPARRIKRQRQAAMIRGYLVPFVHGNCFDHREIGQLTEKGVDGALGDAGPVILSRRSIVNQKPLADPFPEEAGRQAHDLRGGRRRPDLAFLLAKNVFDLISPVEDPLRGSRLPDQAPDGVIP